MKVVRRVLLVFALVGSFALPIFLLAVRHFQLENETAQWIVSIWPQPEAPLEDRRAVADMLVTYGELSAVNMLIYTVLSWVAMIIYWRFFGRAARKRARESKDSGGV